MSRDTGRENALEGRMKKRINLTEGSPGKSLFIFALPPDFRQSVPAVL